MPEQYIKYLVAYEVHGHIFSRKPLYGKWYFTQPNVKFTMTTRQLYELIKYIEVSANRRLLLAQSAVDQLLNGQTGSYCECTSGKE